jgi:hypothetical protein
MGIVHAHATTKRPTTAQHTRTHLRLPALPWALPVGDLAATRPPTAMGDSASRGGCRGCSAAYSSVSASCTAYMHSVKYRMGRMMLESELPCTRHSVLASSQ